MSGRPSGRFASSGCIGHSLQGEPRQITTADIAEVLSAFRHIPFGKRDCRTDLPFRKPPKGWQQMFVRLARERGRELQAFIEELERE